MTALDDRRIVRAAAVVLALLAYVPVLLSSPGKMPADTKLGLYLDPQRLVADAPWTFDARQFAGWVPHQTIAYGWPSGPWYVVADTLGLPDWVAHRLWVGTLLFAGGFGVLWAVRRLGFGAAAAVAAALAYQLSPYVVPYVSRTSSMLLPWAGVGWIIGLTAGAALRSRWRDAALCALVVGTVGSVNATALLMIAPAPVVWLVVAACESRITWRRALTTAARIGGLCVVTSAWWLTMSYVQGRRGADVLAYSEALSDVSFTATSGEVWRSLGYWLMYVRDPYAPTTTAGSTYLTDVVVVAAGYALALLGVLGLVVVASAARRFAVALAVAGVVLAVGLHPFEDPAPLIDVLTGGGESGLALALRSSTRALPLLGFGLAIGLAGLVDAGIPRLLARRPQRVFAGKVVAAGAVGLVAVVNLPMLTSAAFVDPALERDENVPAAWNAAAAELDAAPAGYRVWQLPGAEFGAFRWGYTVDPPLPWLTDRPLITRDLLPLGSPAAMDLAYAVDDRFQNGVAEPTAIAPIARLLGADTIWVTGDAAFDRFRTPRPELTVAFFTEAAAADAGFVAPQPFGEAVVNAPDLAMLDEAALGNDAVGTPVAPVVLVGVADPQPVVRASDREVIVAGSGDGLVDLAGAGLIDGTEALRYSATLDAGDLAAAAPQATLLVVTDTNRLRAHHWRSSQEVTGLTESGAAPAVLRPVIGDARLPVFPDAPLTASTIAVVEGPVQVAASAYGEPFAYQPEQRPANAVDGDPDTAWSVVDHRNQYLEVRAEQSIDHVTLLQPAGSAQRRHLAGATITVTDADGRRQLLPVLLDERSLTEGQRIDIDPTNGPVVVRVELGELVGGLPALPPGVADRSPVGFAEVDLGLGPSHEVVVVPTDLTTALADESAAGEGLPLAYVLTRERASATDRGRADPEWTIVRRIELPAPMALHPGGFAVTVRLDRRADDQVLAALLGIDGPLADRRLTGVGTAAGWAAADGDPATAWITPFQTVVGSTLAVELDGSGTLTLQQRLGDYSPITRLAVRQGETTTVLDVPAPDADGRSTLSLDGFVAGPAELVVEAVEPRTAIDRRYGDQAQLPAAIAELGGVTPTAAVPEQFVTGCRDDLVAIDGSPVAVEVSGSVADALAGEPLTATLCGPLPELAAGAHEVTGPQSHDLGLSVDRIVLSAGGAPTPAAQGAGPTASVVDSGRLHREVEVAGCAEGCWVVLGEGLHPSWSATADGTDLGPPELLQGGFNGWWLPSGADVRQVTMRWEAQRPVTAGVAISAAGALAMVALVVLDRRRRDAPAADSDLTAADPPAPRLVTLAARDETATLVIAAGLAVGGSITIVDVSYWPIGFALAALIAVTRRVAVAGLVALGALALIAADVAQTVLRNDPAPDAGFPRVFENLHHLGVFAAVALGVTVVSGRRSGRRGWRLRGRRQSASGSEPGGATNTATG